MSGAELHRLVVEAMTLGTPRGEAMIAVAARRGLRAGTVAACYWRVEREGVNAERERRRPVQLTLVVRDEDAA